MIPTKGKLTSKNEAGPGAIEEIKGTPSGSKGVIKPKTLALLQEQIKHELFAERLYMSIATWANFKGWPETSDWFEDHAEEEKSHAMDFINFITKRGEHALMPDTEQPMQTFDSIRAAVDMALEHEYFITSKMEVLYATALEEKEFMALEFIRGYIKEQTEEEQLFLSLSAWLTICGDKADADFEMQVRAIHNRTRHIIGEL